MYFVYAVLVHLVFLLMLPVLLLHPRLREGFRFRMGWVPKGWPHADRRPVIWFHGASAGDLAAIRPIISEVRKGRPESFIVVTFITNSGMSMARQGIAGVDAYGYVPYDLPYAVRRVVRAIRPDVLVLEYTEVWPALIRAAKRFGAGLVLTNGRFNPKAMERYRWLYRLIGNPLRKIDWLCMREPDEAERVLALGVDPKKVLVTGNTKFDGCRPLDPSKESLDQKKLQGLAEALGANGSGPMLLFGSTHEGEEGPLLDVFGSVRKKFPAVRLIIAPRYLERVEKVASLIRERGFDFGLRSRGDETAPVMILDSVGELRIAYCLATVVFVGGSFVSRGGQNILEPAACRKPVLFGPHMENFADSVRVLLGRGGIQVKDTRWLERTIVELLSKPEESERLGTLAYETVTAIQGASKLNAEIIFRLLNENERARTHA
jgi:3-deoxy-D-manno-octulosonic-acid transferase